jgi:hypothetical protein
MKRSTPMKRSGSPMKRGAPLAKRSPKMRAKYQGSGSVEGRRDLVARILAARPRCQIGARLEAYRSVCASLNTDAKLGWWKPHLCGGEATEVHEILRRSAGGDILDDANCLATCALCHRWTHETPKTARNLGLLRSRYDQPPTPTSTTTPAEVPE